MGKRGRNKFDPSWDSWKRHEENFIKICPICKNEFDTYGTTNWAYRTKNKYFCSYTCAREYDKIHVQKYEYEE